MSVAERELADELTLEDIFPGVLLDQIPAVFDVRVLAKILCVSVSTAREVMNQPDFPVWIISQHTHRIVKSEFLRYAAEHSTGRRKRGGG